MACPATALKARRVRVQPSRNACGQFVSFPTTNAPSRTTACFIREERCSCSGYEVLVHELGRGAIIRTGHDSTPTPSGVRIVKPNVTAPK
jgi:hypothetical protein